MIPFAEIRCNDISFRKGDFLLSKKGSTRGVNWILLPFGLAVLVMAAAALLFAYLMQNGFLPITWSTILQLSSLSFAALAAGKASGESGRRGAMIGAVLALIWCIWRAATKAEVIFSIYTIAEILLCILCSWLGSCIFHKKRKGYTKRNHLARPTR